MYGVHGPDLALNSNPIYSSQNDYSFLKTSTAVYNAETRRFESFFLLHCVYPSVLFP